MHELASCTNRLTSRWAGDLSGPESTVVSGAGVWPLLALLADAAEGPGRAALADASGLRADACGAAARVLLDLLDGTADAHVALSVWARASLCASEKRRSSLPPATVGELTGDPERDRARVDDWVRRGTRHRIERLPMRLTDTPLMVLATALVLGTRWRTPFADVPRKVRGGPWAGRGITGLAQTQVDPRALRVVSTGIGDITLVTVEATGDFDVALALGAPERAPSDVVPAAIAALSAAPARSGRSLRPGDTAPGVVVTVTPSWSPDPALSVWTVGFEVHAAHDLLDHMRVLGLGTVTDPSRRHFPAIGDAPLAVTAGAQAVTATFSATGFGAMAETALDASPGPAPTEPPYRQILVEAVFDRPFAFLAVHRATGVVLAAGWVAKPGRSGDPSLTTETPRQRPFPGHGWASRLLRRFESRQR